MTNYFLINVPGKYGYSIPVCSNNITPDSFYMESEIIANAVKKNLFYDNEEAEYATVEEMTPYDIEHFSKPGMTIHNID